MRTMWGESWEAYSTNEGGYFHPHGPSGIEASTAPGMLKRLASGRLMLVWNRPEPADGSGWPLQGGDLNWSATPARNYREELSMAFSNDDGKTWRDPVVIACGEDKKIVYPRIFEVEAGVLWVTTMRDGLRVKLHEADFVGNTNAPSKAVGGG